MVARALYMQAGGAEIQLSSINADPQIVRLLGFIWGLVAILLSYPQVHYFLHISPFPTLPSHLTDTKNTSQPFST